MMPSKPFQDTPDADTVPKPEVATPTIVLRPLGFGEPLRWLALGWRDFLRAPGIGLFYGACFMVMGWALLEPENLPFVAAWVAVGAIFASLIYAVSVVSIPMILHRQTDAVTAGLTSLRLVLTQTGVMVWWGLIIAVLVGLALLPWFAGLLLVGPVIGHASWHAYRAAVAD